MPDDPSRQQKLVASMAQQLADLPSQKSDAYLQSRQAAEEEFESWLESLRAIVHRVDAAQKEAKS